MDGLTDKLLLRMEGIQMMLLDKRSNAGRYDSAKLFFVRCIPRHRSHQENKTKIENQ